LTGYWDPVSVLLKGESQMAQGIKNLVLVVKDPKVTQHDVIVCSGCVSRLRREFSDFDAQVQVFECQNIDTFCECCY
jgi:hypothetical protein